MGPAIFSRVLKLEQKERAELLERLGTDPVDREVLEGILDEIEGKLRRQGHYQRARVVGDRLRIREDAEISYN